MWNKFAISVFYFGIPLEIPQIESFVADDALICEAMFNLWLNYDGEYTIKALKYEEFEWRQWNLYKTLKDGFMCLGASGGVWLFNDDFDFFFYIENRHKKD